MGMSSDKENEHSAKGKWDVFLPDSPIRGESVYDGDKMSDVQCDDDGSGMKGEVDGSRVGDLLGTSVTGTLGDGTIPADYGTGNTCDDDSTAGGAPAAGTGGTGADGTGGDTTVDTASDKYTGGTAGVPAKRVDKPTTIKGVNKLPGQTPSNTITSQSKVSTGRTRKGNRQPKKSVNVRNVRPLLSSSSPYTGGTSVNTTSRPARKTSMMPSVRTSRRPQRQLESRPIRTVFKETMAKHRGEVAQLEKEKQFVIFMNQRTAAAVESQNEKIGELKAHAKAQILEYVKEKLKLAKAEKDSSASALRQEHRNLIDEELLIMTPPNIELVCRSVNERVANRIETVMVGLVDRLKGQMTSVNEYSEQISKNREKLVAKIEEIRSRVEVMKPATPPKQNEEVTWSCHLVNAGALYETDSSASAENSSVIDGGEYQIIDQSDGIVALGGSSSVPENLETNNLDEGYIAEIHRYIEKRRQRSARIAAETKLYIRSLYM